MKHVEEIRKVVVHIQNHALGRLRYHISVRGENGEILSRLQGENGQMFLADLTEHIMGKLGHRTQVTVADSDERDVRSKARRVVSKLTGDGF